MSKIIESDFVLDCSMTISWFFPDETTTDTQKIRTLLKNYEANVPSIWQYEIANVLMIAERKHRISEADIVEIKLILSSLPISIDDTSSHRIFGDVLNLAREEKLSVYDAAYLELAMRQGIPLATLDNDLKKAAKKVGVNSL